MFEFPGYCLEWADLNFSVDAEESANYKVWNMCRRKTKKLDILKNVSGHMQTGDLIAVLGSSGSGKTTMLAAVSQRIRGDLTGELILNGRILEREEMTTLSGFLPQFEIAVQSLTAFEHLYFTSHFKMDRRTTRLEKVQKVNNLLFTVGLRDCANTRIRYMSGGEKKRLSLAAELITDPPFLFCDEPTTGLDSYSAFSVVRTLRQLCTKEKHVQCSLKGIYDDSSSESSSNIEMEVLPSGSSVDFSSDWHDASLNGRYRKGVICSIHQPTSDIFELFTHIILMDAGRILYQGSTEDAAKFFTKLDYKCPLNTNPADFYIKTIANPEDAHKTSARILDAFEFQQKTSTGANIWARRASESEYNQKYTEVNKIYWIYQVYLLISRSFIDDCRNFKEGLVKTGIFMITAVTLSVVYSIVPSLTQTSIQDIAGSFFLLTTEVIFTHSYGVLFIFPKNLPIIRREVGERNYSLSAYYTATVLSLMPKVVLKSLLFFGLIYLSVSYTSGFVPYLLMAVILGLAGISGASYGLFLSSLFESEVIGGEMAAPFDLVFIIFGGVYYNVDTIPYIKYFSLFYYANEGMMYTYWKDVDQLECPSNSTLPCVETGMEVLERRSFHSGPWTYVQDCLGLLAVIVAFNLVAFLLIRKYVRRNGYY